MQLYLWHKDRSLEDVQSSMPKNLKRAFTAWLQGKAHEKRGLIPQIMEDLPPALNQQKQLSMKLVIAVVEKLLDNLARAVDGPAAGHERFKQEVQQFLLGSGKQQAKQPKSWEDIMERHMLVDLHTHKSAAKHVVITKAGYVQMTLMWEKEGTQKPSRIQEYGHRLVHWAMSGGAPEDICKRRARPRERTTLQCKDQLCWEAAQRTPAERAQMVHEHELKELDEQQVVMHVCSCRACLSPLHLAWGDRVDNACDDHTRAGNGAHAKQMLVKRWTDNRPRGWNEPPIKIEEQQLRQPAARQQRRARATRAHNKLQNNIRHGRFDGEMKRRQLRKGATAIRCLPGWRVPAAERGQQEQEQQQEQQQRQRKRQRQQ